MKLVRAKEGYRKVGDKYLLAKKCTKCGRWLVASTANFNRKKDGKYGLKSECKECRNNKDYPVNTDPNITKICTTCGKEFPAIQEYFHKNKTEKYGLESQCKECKKRYREVNREKIAKQKKQYYEDNKDKIAKHHKRYYETNREKAFERQKQWREANKDKKAEYDKRYYEANREKIAKYNKQWYEDNKDKRTQYYKNNKEKIAEHKKRYRQSPQGQVVEFNRHQRRRIKEEQQGTGITKDQWLEMMSFFDWRCAYSGEYLGGNDNSFNRTIDHIVPLNSGGDNMIWNCVPMLRNLNSSKSDKDMLEWYKEQDFYDSKRLQKIYKWQEYAYNKYGKDSEYFNTNDIQITLL